MQKGLLILVATLFLSGASAQEIERRLPPTGGMEVPEVLRQAIEERLKKLEETWWELENEDNFSDVGVFGKAVRYALDHNEFYDKKHLGLPMQMLDHAEERMYRLADGERPWKDQRGLLVRGYESSIDDSLQPYGLEIPENLDLTKPVPLLVWLHGRGDKVTDMHFIARCLAKSQALGGKVGDQQNAIIVHPFGRQCVGFKHAGEIDVLEVIDEVMREYPIDPDKIALAGFSMGGAGAWHIGAHYRDRFCAVHAGAGFAETAMYNKLTPDQYPSPIEQTLWKVYDVPNYTRNLLNGPLLAYSGEDDKQKQAADLMAAEIAKVGGELHHEIGPGMGHKYHDDSVKVIWQWLLESWETGRQAPATVELQTPTTRYSKIFWMQAVGLEDHWSGASLTGTARPNKLELTTENVDVIRVTAPDGKSDLGGYEVIIDKGSSLKVDDAAFPIASAVFQKTKTGWAFGEPAGLRKKPGLQGPIDDAFMSRFVVVAPKETATDAKQEKWIQFELKHFQSRWRALMRGDALKGDSDDLNFKDIANSNLILFGTPDSNSAIAEIVERLPIQWTADKIVIGDQEWSAKTHLPALIYPNPLNPERYVVINSGLTFRENHDRTNSLQNPKLGDWAVIDITVSPSGDAPGKVVATDFFNEQWQVK